MGEPPPAERRRVHDRYALGRKLGGGGQGTTWEAVDEAVGRHVAVKEFRIAGAASWKDVELAEREATVLARLSHPRLPAYVDHFEEAGSLFLVMEMIEGEPVSRTQDVSVKDVLRFLADAASVLDYLHDRAPPVIHRDIKPSNVIRRPDGSFAIVDFGAVRAELKPEGGSTVVGTFGYMAPEQFQGRALPVTDVYAVGATAMTMLTGSPPEDLPHRGLAIDVRAALESTRAPLALVELLVRMLQPDPDQRPARLTPLLESLVPPPAPRAHVGEPPPERERARPGSSTSAEPVAQGADVLLLPPGAAALFHVALGVARIAVGLALGVLVPVLLTLLSIMFGPGLRRAARSVRQAGRQADAALARTATLVQSRRGVRRRRSRRQRQRHRRRREEIRRRRVDDERSPPSRARVDATGWEAPDPDEGALWDEEDDETANRNRR